MDNPELTKTLQPYSSWVSRSKGILAPVVALGNFRSALDLGCNCGPWLGALNDLGVHDVIGVNDLEIWDNILFDRSLSVVHDLSHPLDLGRRFDLVLCLEVAEHVGGGDAGADELITTIEKHGDTVLFSAATPGQWGDGHVNCQPHEYWHERFKRKGFHVWDVMRPILQQRADTEDWYKANMFLYTRRAEICNAMPPPEIPIGKQLPDKQTIRASGCIDENWLFFVRCYGSRNYDDSGVLASRLPRLRMLYPRARIAVSAPWESLRAAEELHSVAIANGCECVPMEKDLHSSERGAACLRSMLDLFLAEPASQILVKFDPDTMFHRRISPPNCAGVHGCPETLTGGGDEIHPANLQGGCLIYTRDAAERLVERSRMEDLTYWADYATSWARGVNDWLNHGEKYGTLDDAISRHACLISGVPMCVHPEVLSYYTAPAHADWWQGFAVSHPHKN